MNSPVKPQRHSFTLVKIILINLLLFLFVAELFLRFKFPYVIDLKEPKLIQWILTSDLASLYERSAYGKRLRANTRVLIRNHPFSKENVHIRVNDKGFRGESIPEKKAENEYRILVLGDSLTLQDYLPEEDLFTELMQRELNASQSQRLIRVINGGNTDFGLKEEIAFLEDRGLPIQPNMVIVGFYLNDSEPSWGVQGKLGIKKKAYWLRSSLALSRLYLNYKLYQWAKRTGFSKFQWTKQTNRLDWKHNRDAFLALAKEARYGWGAAWQEDSWAIIDQGLRRLEEISKKNHFQVFIVIFPVAYQVEAHFLENKPQQLLKNTAVSLGFDTYDPLPMLREHKDSHLFYDECHLTRTSNNLIGQGIVRILKERYITENPL